MAQAKLSSLIKCRPGGRTPFFQASGRKKKKKPSWPPNRAKGAGLPAGESGGLCEWFWAQACKSLSTWVWWRCCRELSCPRGQTQPDLEELARAPAAAGSHRRAKGKRDEAAGCLSVGQRGAMCWKTQLQSPLVKPPLLPALRCRLCSTKGFGGASRRLRGGGNLFGRGALA